MKNLSLVALVVAYAAAAACGGQTKADDSADLGGATSSGGTEAVGGAADTGGDPGAGGMPSTSGGAPNSGGSPESGGAGTGGEPERPSVLDHAPPSCAGLEDDACQGEDCCTSLLVPGGVTIDGDFNDEFLLPPFYLDKYEVTVARFRRYMAAVEGWIAEGNPADGAGAHPLEPASGWRGDWMTVDEEDDQVAQLIPNWLGFPSETGLSVCCGNPTYQIEGSDQLAVNHVSFHAAYAFCIWDGGRLPIELEWLYMAHGGDEQRTYPWGDAPGGEVIFPGLPAATVPTPYEDDAFWQYIGIPVGSHQPAGGRFGHQDLIGGMTEYVRDTATRDRPGPVALFEDEVVRGQFGLGLVYTRVNIAPTWGDIEHNPETLIAWWDHSYPSSGIGSGTTGFRCARDVDE